MNYPYQFPQFQQIPQVPQVPQNSIVAVRTEEEAQRYPIAPGNSIMFKIENQPVIIEKIMGFSQLESPQIRRYRLIEEEPQPQVVEEYALKADLAKIEEEINALRDMLPKRPVKKKEADDE